MALSVKSDLDFENLARIINLLDPTSAQHPATKAYVDSAIEGLNWKDSCRVSTQSNTNLAAPGATIDGISMSLDDRFLSRVQTAGAENGIYIWNGAAVPATRSADMNTAAEVEQAITAIEEGTSAGVSYRQTQVNVTLGTTALIWTTFGVVAPAASETTAGIAELATQAETDTGTDDLRIVTPLKLTSFSGRAKRYASTFGDGAATQYDLTHNLGTLDVVVQVVRVSDGASVECQQTRTSTTVVRLNFASAPATNTLRAVVIA